MHFGWYGSYALGGLRVIADPIAATNPEPRMFALGQFVNHIAAQAAVLLSVHRFAQLVWVLVDAEVGYLYQSVALSAHP